MTNNKHTAITLVEAALARAGVADDATLAVGVSGGADSTALALLLHELRPIVALTVDHGLRDGSDGEAAAVAKAMAEHGIKHHTLTWAGEKPTTNLQAAAREARYSLMDAWCAKEGISYLALGHHMDDQAETFLLRLARGSGVYGLAAMSEKAGMPRAGSDVTLLRPLLRVEKTALISFLGEYGESWIEDPSNEMDRFDRVKLRQFMQDSPLPGLSADKLAATAARLERARSALEHYSDVLLSEAASVHTAGYVSIDPVKLLAAPEEISLRCLARVLRHVSGEPYSARLEKLETCLAAIQGEDFKGSTLSGCQILPQGEMLLIGREPRAAERAGVLRENGLWDNRFNVTVTAKGRVAALGDDGWSQIARRVEGSALAKIPHAFRLSLPALWRDGNIIAQPHFGVGEGLEAEFSPTHSL